MSAELFPTKPPAADPRETACEVCRKAHVGCVVAGHRYCREHAPADYWPAPSRFTPSAPRNETANAAN